MGVSLLPLGAAWATVIDMQVCTGILYQIVLSD
jgi:hypothetical protein